MATQILDSSRPCPNCRGTMVYTKSLSTFLTGLYRRVCKTCGYMDPKRVKLVRLGVYK